MHIIQNQDLKNVVLAVGIMANVVLAVGIMVGLDCAWVKLHMQNRFAVDVIICWRLL